MPIARYGLQGSSGNNGSPRAPSSTTRRTTSWRSLLPQISLTSLSLSCSCPDAGQASESCLGIRKGADGETSSQSPIGAEALTTLERNRYVWRRFQFYPFWKVLWEKVLSFFQGKPKKLDHCPGMNSLPANDAKMPYWQDYPPPIEVRRKCAYCEENLGVQNPGLLCNVCEGFK